MRKLTVLLSGKDFFSRSRILMFLLPFLIFLGAFIGSYLLKKTYEMSFFFKVSFFLLLLLILLFVVILILFEKTGKSILFISILLIIFLFSIVYRYIQADINYKPEILSSLIEKYPYFIAQVTDYQGEYEKYSKSAGFIISFTDGITFYSTRIPVNIYCDSLSNVSSDQLLVFKSSILKRYCITGGKISINRTDIFKILKQGSKFGKLRVKIKEKLYNGLLKYYDRWNAASIYAIITGSKQFAYQPLFELYRKTGTSHLYALSGQHLGILILILGIFSKNPIFLLLCSFFYLAFAGWQVSFLRAFFSLFVAYVIRYFNLKPKFENSIALVIFFVFLAQPEQILSISLLLSITAIASLFIIYQYSEYQSSKIIKSIFIPILTSLDIFIFQLPLLLAFFGNVNLLTPLINIFAIPFFTVALYFAILSLFINPFRIFSVISSGFFDLISIMLAKLSTFEFSVIEYNMPEIICFILMLILYFIHSFLSFYLDRKYRFLKPGIYKS